MPSEGWADLGFLQQGQVTPCGVPGLVPHTWRRQLDSWELRVPSDTTHGLEQNGRGHSANGLRAVGKQSKPTAVGTFSLHDKPRLHVQDSTG